MAAKPRLFLAFAVVLALPGASSAALADPPAPRRVASTGAAPGSTGTPWAAPQPGVVMPAAAPAGLVVVAIPGATDAAWPLARAVYDTPSLRPAAIDDVHARVLCGEPAAADAPGDVRDIAADVAAVHGDDAPSRALLSDVARRTLARAVVVVFPGPPGPSARVFLADSATFDAAAYSPDALAGGAGATLTWSAAVASLARTFGAAVATANDGGLVAPLPHPGSHDGPTIDNEPPHHRRFYESGWFWGAVGAALFAGGAVYFATRDNGPETIHLQLQVPH